MTISFFCNHDWCRSLVSHSNNVSFAILHVCTIPVASRFLNTLVDYYHSFMSIDHKVFKDLKLKFYLWLTQNLHLLRSLAHIFKFWKDYLDTLIPAKKWLLSFTGPLTLPYGLSSYQPYTLQNIYQKEKKQEMRYLRIFQKRNCRRFFVH